MGHPSRRSVLLGVVGVVPIAGCIGGTFSEAKGAHLSVSNFTETERTVRVEITADGERVFQKSPTLPPAESIIYEHLFRDTLATTVTVTVDGIGERSTTWQTNAGVMLEVVVEDARIRFEVSSA